LDSQTAESVFDLFLKLVDDGKTLVMVTHDVNLVDRIPRIVEIRNGLISCDSIAAPEIFTAAPRELENISREMVSVER
jgi:ABC-type lipoprotein export system ATPase subunit